MPRTGLTAEQIKEKTIEATLARMRKVGFEKVRLTDIAKDLRVSHAALYSHFKDKSELLDAVSEVWLSKLNKKLESICRLRKDPCEKIKAWVLAIHRSKIEKVRSDPELYKAFDMASEQSKPFVKHHLETMHQQLTGLVNEAIAKGRLRSANSEVTAKIIGAATLAFHHPRLVALYIDENREPLLHQVLDSVLNGLAVD